MTCDTADGGRLDDVAVARQVAASSNNGAGAAGVDELRVELRLVGRRPGRNQIGEELGDGVVGSASVWDIALHAHTALARHVDHGTVLRQRGVRRAPVQKEDSE